MMCCCGSLCMYVSSLNNFVMSSVAGLNMFFDACCLSIHLLYPSIHLSSIYSNYLYIFSSVLLCMSIYHLSILYLSVHLSSSIRLPRSTSEPSFAWWMSVICATRPKSMRPKRPSSKSILRSHTQIAESGHNSPIFNWCWMSYQTSPKHMSPRNKKNDPKEVVPYFENKSWPHVDDGNGYETHELRICWIGASTYRNSVI